MYEESIVIYSDILFLINFSLDYLCLFIAGRLLHRGGRVWRLLLGALAGGFYSFIPYLFEPSVFVSFPLDIFAAILICLIAFEYQSAKSLALTSGTFIVSSALLGGLITAIYSLLGEYSNGVYSEVSPLSFCLICLFSALIALSYGLICRKKIHTHSAELKIYLKNTHIRARLLCDSGNLVTEPFSALPVIVLSSSCLPPPYDDPEGVLFPLAIRAIPFSTANGKGCFLGFRPEKIYLLRPARKPKIIEAYVGIDTERKSYSGYDGLIPASLL